MHDIKVADTKDSGDSKDSPGKETTHDGSQEMINLPPQHYLAAERATMYIDQFRESRDMAPMVTSSGSSHVVPGQKLGNHLQYSYRPELGSGGSGMMWFGGGSGGDGGGSGGVINYGLSSSPSYDNSTSSMGSWAAAGQKRTRSEESSVTQFSGQQLQKLQRGIVEGSSSLSSGLSDFFHEIPSLNH